MGLLSLFQRKARQQTGGAPARTTVDPAAAAEAVRDARTRARRRLMGATVLLLVGVIGFPLLFETRPRPIPVDLPIEIPARTPAAALGDGGNAPRANRLASSVAAAEVAASATAQATPTPTPTPTLTPIVTETAQAPAPASVAAPATITPSAAHPVQFAASTMATRAPAPSPARVATTAAAPSPASSPAASAKPAASAARPAASKPVTSPVATSPAPPARASAPATPPATATAAAEKASDAAADSGHYVVQIGAFAEQPKAHEARMKVEKLGLKTYVQVVDTAQGKRIRVRVGPYPTKAEADKAAARIKGDGLPAAVLLL
jgi:DedD protein